jgi:NAD-dependent dihydropyrimidine dehydrogenase PreA subunit
MLDFIEKPREELSPFAPRLLRKVINPDKIGALIGPGGKTIKMIQEQANVNIEVDDTGVVVIDPEKCFGCGVCANLCPNGAIRMVEAFEKGLPFDVDRLELM